jgi:nicotinic acid mononucleotide adenylyltransferase
MRIAIYPGSFDPIHKGHTEIIDLLSKDPSIDKIFVTGTLPNKGKPLRSSNKVRFEMISIVTKDMDKITSTDRDVHELVDSLKNDYLIGIIGIDCWLQLKNNNKEPKLKVNEYWIVPRNNDVSDVKYKDYKVKLLDNNYKYQDYSSSEARVSVYNSYFTGRLLEYVNPDVIKYIKQGNLYSRHYYANLIMNLVLKTSDFKLEAMSSFTSNGSMNIYMTDTLALKFLNTNDEIKDYDKAHTLLEKHNMPIVKSSLIIGNPVYAILMDRINGLSIYETIKKLFNTKVILDNDDITYVNTIGYKLGQVLRKVHSIEPTHLLDDNFLSSNKKIQKMQKYIPNIQELLSKYKLSEIAFNVHGDANLGNFMLDSNNEIVLIDYNTSYDLPGYEYWQLMGSIDVQLKEFKLNKIFTDGFEKGYGPLHESYDLFRDYWIKCQENSLWATSFPK